MALPKIAVPKFKIELPSNKKEVYFRPFLVKEEKTLLMALEGKDENEITEAVINIIDTCLDYDGDVRELPFFDIEYVFTQLRARSINNIIDLNLQHASNSECNHVTKYSLNLEDVKVDFPEDFTNNIEITDGVGLKMKYPSIKTVNSVNENLRSSKIDNVFYSIAANIECIYDEENVYDEFTQEEIVEWLGQLNKEQFFKVVSFFEKMPTVSCDIKYICEECGKEEFIPMRGLQSFFI